MTEFTDLLSSATQDELRLLSQLLKCPDATPAALTARLQKISSSFFAWHLADERLTYREIVLRVAKHLGISAGDRSTADLELTITDRLWCAVWERMTPDQQKEFKKKVAEVAKECGQSTNFNGLALTIGSMLAAKASGFGIYLLVSSTLGALTSGLGITLPFGVYMTMASTVSLVLGPVGFLGLGLLAFHKITGPDHSQMALAIVAVCGIRSRIRSGRPEPKSNLPAWILIAACLLAVIAGLVWIRSADRPRLNPGATTSSAPLPTTAQVANGIQQLGPGEIRFGDSLFRITEAGAMPSARSATLTIQRSDGTLRTLESARFYYSSNLCGNEEWLNPGDVDGDANSELVISDYSGGAQPWTRWHVFKASKSGVSEYLTIQNGHAFECPFSDLNGDRLPEARTADLVFTYWPASPTGSRMPFLSFRLVSTGLEFAPDLMLKDPPTPGELESWAASLDWRGRSSDNPPPELTDRLVTLLEGGHAKLIPAFLNMAWPARVAGKSAFLQSFGQQLRFSEHYAQWDLLSEGLSRVFDETDSLGTVPSFDTTGRELPK